MTPRDFRNIYTTRNSCRDALPCANMALKVLQYFYLLMEKPLGHYFQVWSPYYQVAQCNQKTPIPVSSRWQIRSEKAKKGEASALITATTSVHFPKSVWAIVFSCENHYQCYKKLLSRFWPMLFTFTYFLFYIDPLLLQNKKLFWLLSSSANCTSDHYSMIYILRLFWCEDWFQYD